MSTPTASSSNLRSLIYEVVDGKPTLQVLDQLLLPAEKKYISVPNIQTAWSVIHKMQIRGKNRAKLQAYCVLVRSSIPVATCLAVPIYAG
jgi:methylthioribose-1-phosphate isomerase